MVPPFLPKCPTKVQVSPLIDTFGKGYRRGKLVGWNTLKTSLSKQTGPGFVSHFTCILLFAGPCFSRYITLYALARHCHVLAWRQPATAGACIAILVSNRSARNARRRPKPFTGSESNAPPTKVVLRRQFFSWRDVESADYPTYVANLSDIGCPEQTGPAATSSSRM